MSSPKYLAMPTALTMQPTCFDQFQTISNNFNRLQRRPANANPFLSPILYTATLLPGGLMFAAPVHLTLLQSAELANTPGLQMASSCRNGTCRTCICQLAQGDVNYRIDWPGLSLDEKANRFILPCVAYPVSDVVIQLMP